MEWRATPSSGGGAGAHVGTLIEFESGPTSRIRPMGDVADSVPPDDIDKAATSEKSGASD